MRGGTRLGVFDHMDSNGRSESLVLINEKVWQRASAEHQKLFIQAARGVERDVRERSVQLNE
jgi:TRAP-type C4-dicarboxylate transport system substrate-binding protein